MPENASPRGTVLIVEDHEGIREALRDLLEDEAYAVLEADDGLAGLALLRASRVALVVLLDYIMPRMDGFALLRAVVNDLPLFARHTFILLTANDDCLPPAFVALLKTLHTPIIGKPFELEDVVDAIAAAQRALGAPSPAEEKAEHRSVQSGE